jgi:Xaa-Pro aminopeptidase
LLDSVEVDSVLISEPIHVYYLTGLKAALEPRTSVETEQNPMFLGISKNGATFLIAARTTLANPFITDEVIFDSSRLFDGKLWTYGDYDVDERISTDVDFVAEELSEVMSEMKSREGFGLENVGVEEKIPYGTTARLAKEFPQIKFSQISAAVRKIRLTKDGTEVSSVKEGIRRLAEVSSPSAAPMIPGETEIQALERMRKLYGEKFGHDSFLNGQILSGKRTSEVFGKATQKKLVAGERVILDLETIVDGYHAKQVTTRIIGRESAPEDESTGPVRQALEAGEGKLLPGNAAKEVYDAVSSKRREVDSSKLVHEAGHGIGLQSKEEPYLIPSSNQAIAIGMVCVLTAGSYMNSAGSRFSASYVVEKSGPAKL